MRLFLLLSIIISCLACQSTPPIESIDLADSVIYQLNEEVLGHHISRKDNQAETRLLTKRVPRLQDGTVTRQVTSRNGELFTPDIFTFKTGKLITFQEHNKEWTVKYDDQGRIIQAGAERRTYLSQDSILIEKVHDNAIMVKQGNCDFIHSESKGSHFDIKTKVCYNEKGLRVSERSEYVLDGKQKVDGNTFKYDQQNRLTQNREYNIVEGDTTRITSFQFEYNRQGLLESEAAMTKGRINSPTFRYKYQVIQANPLVIKQTQTHEATVRKTMTYRFDEANRVVAAISSKGTKRSFTYN